MSTPRLLLSCEHGGNLVPARWRALFRGRGRALASHRGQDLGAFELARELSRALDAPLVATRVTRLLVDANRSASSPELFSPFTAGLPAAERVRILARHWRPHRAAVEREARRLSRRGLALHVSVHSFTPVLRGERRAVDVGVLFDPAREPEASLARRLARALARELPRLRVRLNRPYAGTADGLTTALRAKLPASRYAGIELELSQRFPRGAPARWRAVRRNVAAALREILA